MTVAEIAEKKAIELMESRTTAELVEMFEETELVNDPHIYTVRGWVMDELEKRNAEAFDKWIDSEEDSPRKFFLN